MNRAKTKFILGTVQAGMPYGIQNQGKPPVYDFDKAVALLKQAADSGVDTFDTSNHYGRSQEAISRLESRNRIRILSKFSLSPSAPTVRENLEATLRSLNVAKISAYSFHKFDDFLKSPQALKELKALKSEGLIGQIGVSVYGNDQLAAAIESSEIELIQLPFNVLDNLHAKGTLLSEAKRRGKTLHARSLFLQGLLLMKPSEVPKNLQTVRPLIEKIGAWASEASVEMETLCLGYASQSGLFDGLVIGVDTPGQLQANLRRFKESLSVAFDWSRFSELKLEDKRYLNPSLWNSL